MNGVPVLIVDGYNVIHAWPSLKQLLQTAGAEEARRGLIAALADYVAVTHASVTVVFDGPRGGVGAGQVEVVDGVLVRFSGSHGSADHLIERLAYQAARAGAATQVLVATNDRLQGDLVRAMGVGAISAATLQDDVSRARADTRRQAAGSRDQARFTHRVEHHLPADVAARLEAMRRGEKSSTVPTGDTDDDRAHTTDEPNDQATSP